MPPTPLRPRIIAVTIGSLLLGGALYVGARPVGAIPPLGPLLDPAHGVWALAGHSQFPVSASGTIAELGAEVDVRYDDRGVPHIFAANELDALRALGFVVARDRLFQLELQTRAASGTLTELVGSRALDADRTARRIGLPWGAQRKFAAIEPGSIAARAMHAYADGVNAYIDAMRPADLPFEYRLLNRKPQRWKPEHTMYLLVRMGYTLAYSDFELKRAAIEARVGTAATDALFPRNAYIQEPIQPNGQREPRVDARTIPRPRPDSAAALFATITSRFAPSGVEPAGSIGSNNWAVSPSRSASGYALLANDPHLELTLPSTWYEAHIVVRDTLDVYGVTFPGAPAIALGLTRDIAWGSTNVGADVADYYMEVVDDSAAPTRYRIDGVWRDVERSVEEYRTGRGTLLATDTLYYTHRGTLFRVGDTWVSRRWLVLEPSLEFEAFRAAPRAHTVREFFEAMSSYVAPAQNFVVADRQGHIGIRTTGRFPIRPGNRGDRFFDGSTSASDWQGWITPEQAPQSIDPPQGFVASANQQPADPRSYPAYLGIDWPSPWRAIRINMLLRKDSAVTFDAMRLYQTDPGNARADAFVPLLLDAVAATLRSQPGDSVLARAATLLGEWDRRYTLDNQRAVLFEDAMREVARLTWDELAEDRGDTAAVRLIAAPWDHVLLALTRDATSVWWDRDATPARESRDDIFALALRTALINLEALRGPAEQGNWRWERIRMANIWHPMRLRPLSALDLPVQAGRESLNQGSGAGTHGPSWRLVTEMGPAIRAWAIYPGGQSANPVSQHYRDRIETWRRGELDSLRIPATPNDLTAAHLASRLTLSARR